MDATPDTLVSPSSGDTFHHADASKVVHEGFFNQEADISKKLEMLKATIRMLEDFQNNINSSVVDAFVSDATVRRSSIPETLGRTVTTFDKKPAPPRLPAIAKLHRVNWTGFKNSCWCTCEEHCADIPDEFKRLYAIDVLMGLPKFFWQRNAEQREKRKRLHDVNTSVVPIKPDSLSDAPEGSRIQREMPERIRINSAPVLAILRDIIDKPDLALTPLILLRPYKVLVHYESEIRKHLYYLKERWNNNNIHTPFSQHANAVGDLPRTDYFSSLSRTGVDNSSSVVSPGVDFDGVSTATEDLIDSPEAYRDLKCLVEFMDTDIIPVMKHIRSDSCQKIFFRDLWYMFKPGDEVYCPVVQTKKGPRDSHTKASQKGGLWRVLQVGQGRPVLSPHENDDPNRPPSQRTNPFNLYCYRIDYDGNGFGPAWNKFEMKYWDGERDIKDLQLIPLRLHEERQEIKERYIVQGQKFLKFTAPRHQIYTGSSVNYYHDGELCEVARPMDDIDGYVMVDYKEAVRQDQRWVINLYLPEPLPVDPRETDEDFPRYVWRDREHTQKKCEQLEEIYEDDDIDKQLMIEHIRRDTFLSTFKTRIHDEEVDGHRFGDDELRLLPNFVCGFILQRRSFALLKLTGMKPVDPNTDNWNDLKLLKKHKGMVSAQVKAHFNERQSRDSMAKRKSSIDLVRGKGQGLIILLHGVPGVGKTSTAECIAEYFGKPLYPLTCGDLGTTAAQIQESLDQAFAMAQTWGCVLLLDEADVFLAERQRTDIERNAVVSVFLRALEYYTGILFLTTNRIGALDAAFISRIHVFFYYPPLNWEQTEAIWKVNLERLIRRKGQSIIRDHGLEEEILHFARDQFKEARKNEARWNGRQIRNAFQTVAALAEYDALEEQEQRDRLAKEEGREVPTTPIHPRLKIEYFETIANAAGQFDSYLRETHGVTEAKRAYDNHERADDWKIAPLPFGSSIPQSRSIPIRDRHPSMPSYSTRPDLDDFSPGRTQFPRADFDEDEDLKLASWQHNRRTSDTRGPSGLRRFMGDDDGHRGTSPKYHTKGSGTWEDDAYE